MTLTTATTETTTHIRRYSGGGGANKNKQPCLYWREETRRTYREDIMEVFEYRCRTEMFIDRNK